MRRPTLATIPLLLATSPVAAEELQLGWDVINEYESRVVDSNDDVNWQFGPSVRLSGEYPKLDYSVFYRAMFEAHGEIEDFNGWYHELISNGRWQVTPRNEIRVSDSFYVAPSLQSLQDEVVGIEDPTLEFQQNDILTNSFVATWSATPTPRIGTSVQVAHFLLDYEDPTLRSQSTDAVTLNLQGSYLINASHTAGVGFRLNSRNFEVGQTLDERTTNTYQVFASWVWTIDERTRFDVQAGPAFAEDEAFDVQFQQYGRTPSARDTLVNALTCPVRRGLPLLDGSCGAIAGQRALTSEEQRDLDDSEATLLPAFDLADPESDTNVSGYFSLNFLREWDRVQFSTGWVRSDSQTEGLGSATIQDSIHGMLAWDFQPRWRAAFSYRFTRRFTDIDRDVALPLLSPVPEFVDLEGSGGPLVAFPIVGSFSTKEKLEQTDDTHFVEFRVTREWGRASHVFAEILYHDQEFRTETEFLDEKFQSDQFWVRFGVYYRFGPIRF